MCKRHLHADVIIAWAEGKLIQIKQPNGEWEDVKSKSPMFDPKWEYRIKPKPVEVTSCNGVVITPMTTVPEINSRYYLADPTLHSLHQEHRWRDDESDRRFFACGLVHKTEASARHHASVMLETKKEVYDV